LAQVDASSIVPINPLIAGLLRNNREKENMQLFQQLLRDDLKPSSLTFSSILSGCTGLSSSILCKQVHCYTLKSGLLNDDTSLGVSLIGIYLKSKMPEDANKLLIEVPDHKSLFEWTAIISGYAQNGYSSESFLSFWRMRSYDVHSDEATFASILKACSKMIALSDGKEIPPVNVLRTVLKLRAFPWMIKILTCLKRTITVIILPVSRNSQVSLKHRAEAQQNLL
jgi:hypothetical protein